MTFLNISPVTRPHENDYSHKGSGTNFIPKCPMEIQVLACVPVSYITNQ